MTSEDHNIPQLNANLRHIHLLRYKFLLMVATLLHLSSTTQFIASLHFYIPTSLMSDVTACLPKEVWPYLLFLPAVVLVSICICGHLARKRGGRRPPLLGSNFCVCDLYYEASRLALRSEIDSVNWRWTRWEFGLSDSLESLCGAGLLQWGTK